MLSGALEGDCWCVPGVRKGLALTDGRRVQAVTALKEIGYYGHLGVFAGLSDWGYVSSCPRVKCVNPDRMVTRDCDRQALGLASISSPMRF